MKIEINNENKAKFFALYYAQDVCENPFGKYYVNARTLDYTMTDSLTAWLNLKPLSSISDEDARFICSFHKVISTDYIWSFLQLSLNGFDYDYLRSKGYAFSWMGLSVEEMVQADWIKLTK